MKSIPQLKVRTEYSFRSAFGPVDKVAARLEEIGCPAAGIVDRVGTWGHAAWEGALKKRDIPAAFGAEFVIPTEDGRKPTCWVLAENLRAFYRLSSSNPSTPREMAEATGVIRFAGAALTDPDAFDYIDLNPRSIGECLRRVKLAEETGKPMVLTSDNDYPAPGDRDRFLAWDDSKKMTQQHILDADEMRRAFWFLSDEVYSQARRNTFEVAERVAGKSLEAAPMIWAPGDLAAEVEEGREVRLAQGVIPEWTDVYQKRLERELELIKHKDYESYFIVVADLVKWAKTKMLVGPARGSSAGSLVCYLLGITEVDPIVHELIFERFIDINRDDLPDIDIDFNDKKRDMVFGYLADKYGVENVAKIGSVNRLKPRSVMAHAGKKLGIPAGSTFAVLNVLVEHSSGSSLYGQALRDTIENTKPGQEFAARYPEGQLIGELENHASHSGVHAAGIIVANEPVIEFCTVRDGVAQIDKKDAEHLNLLKIDALGLRTLGVIEDTGRITNEELYAMRFDDPDVLRIFDEEKFSGLFQFEGAAQRRVSVQIPITSFKKIDHVTALARPGPLGGGAANTYINRNLGREEVAYRHPSMSTYLADTMGVVLYQEQVMRIVREIGQFSWEETSIVRKAMSASKGKEFFNERAARFAEGARAQGISDEDAHGIWEEIYNFGAWGMNKSHTTSYAMISYWCAYMKRYFPIEYAAACLRSAKDDEQAVEILRELVKEGVPYEPFDPEHSEANWTAKEGKVYGGYTNLVGIGPVKARKYIEKRDAGGLTEKDLEDLAAKQVKHQDLWPAHTLYGDVYRNPELYNIRGRVREFTTLDDQENGCVVARLVKKSRRDDNENVLINKRGGEVRKGQTLFLDMFVVDDSTSKPVTCRIRPRNWDAFGEIVADRAVEGQDWFLIRGRWLKDFSMMIVDKVKCLTNPEMFT
jgi:DNA-directed DNA polymerase III PolC